MKTIFTTCMFFVFLHLNAQEKFFIHTATDANSDSEVTYLDHPDLNGNPNAKILVTHLLESGNSYNDHVSGVYFDGTNWMIYNEDINDLVIGSKYLVYIASDANSYLHTVDGSNLYSPYSMLDVNFSNSETEEIVLTNRFTSDWNDSNVGVWYDINANGWKSYNEDDSFVVEGDSYIVAKQGDIVIGAKHISQASNIVGNYTVIDHPLLNGNPNAKFIIQHNWGAQGQTYNTVFNSTLGVWYDGANWTVYTEDYSTFLENVLINMLIEDEYCVPMMYSGFENITNVTFSGINNDSGVEDGVVYFLEQEANVTQGQTYPLSVSINPDSEEYIYAFIDWNQDGDFDDVDESYLVADAVDTAGPFTSDIDVPSDATLGKTRMRVMLVYSNEIPNPCYVDEDGESEDYTVVVEEGMGVDDIISLAVKAYPNPVDDVVNFMAKERILSIEILNLSGQNLLSEKQNSNTVQMNLSNLPSGIYLAKVETENSSETIKIIKK